MRGVALWLALIGALCLHAQTPSGEIRLSVKDPSGAPMRVAGKLVNRAAGVDRSFQTDAQGSAVLSGLPFGQYRLDVTKSGFKAQSVTVSVQSSQPVAQTVQMALAAQTSAIEVVAATPLAGTDMAIAQSPAPVQTAGVRDLEQSGALDLSDLLNRRLDGVHINENQENPFQPDVNYRGYTASPLLGTPEGISVYVDGVRQNQPFGDIVAWDLIPKVAIDEIALMPGSNPLFGLNTLGGALSVQTKDGNSAPGASLEISGGSFGRRAGEFEYGGSNRYGLNWYAAGNLFREDGWRQDSPSEVRQVFGKLGWLHDGTSASLSFGYAGNWLTGNGLQDTRVLAHNYSNVYSIPDVTWNHSPAVNFSLRQNVTRNFTLSGNLYFRFIRTDTINGDINSDSFDQSLYNLSTADVNALRAAGYSGFPTTGNAATEPFPYWRCIAQGLEMADPSERCTGITTRTNSRQNNYGASGQAGWQTTRHHLVAGMAWDRSSLTFAQGSQFGYLNADHLTITPIDSFADGSTSAGGVPVDTRVNLHGLINTVSAYVMDTISLGPLAFTASGRYNRTSIDNLDRLPLDPTGARGSLNGNYVFSRFNPSAGVTYSPWKTVGLYFSYSQASRAPTAIELGCANPDQPCNFPNALVSDPPLQQVVTHTWEAGVRGSLETLRWSAGWFRASNLNDLLFVASQQTGFGYFTNFGQTRRQGIEASISRKFGRATLGGNYTLLNATYESSQVLDGHVNSSNDAGPGLDGGITVQPGDRIPQTPQNILKSYAEYQATRKLDLDLDFLAVGRSFARGNENNLYRPDGVYYLGPGFSPGYGVVNVAAHYQLRKRVQLFVEVNNLLDHHYYSGAQLGSTPFDNAGNFVARPFAAVDGNFPIRTTTFFAPGAPFGAWGGLRFKW